MKSKLQAWDKKIMSMFEMWVGNKHGDDKDKEMINVEYSKVKQLHEKLELKRYKMKQQRRSTLLNWI